MKIGIFGTGDVGQALGRKLVASGHEVMLGARAADNAKAAAWVAEVGEGASQGTFADAAAFGALVLHCTSGAHALTVVELAGAEALAGKVMIDVTNPLDFSNGFPPTLSVCNDSSLAEQLQAALPQTHVVKALNTVANSVMVNPSGVPGDHTLLICGDDADAKTTVTALLREGLGWTHVLDLGDITNARGTEAYLLLWTRLWRALGTGDFNIQINVAPSAD